MRSVRFGAMALLVAAFGGLTVFGAADEKPKFEIEKIMEKAHDKDDGILKVVLAGKASDAQKEELLALYVELAKNKPPKGDAKSWKTKTQALVVAAKEVVAGKDQGVGHLKKAANCKACHALHKGD